MPIQNAINTIGSTRLQRRLNKKYEAELANDTADVQTIFNDIKRWQSINTFLLVLACIFTLGITPFIYLCVAAAKNRGVEGHEKRSLNIVKRPSELVQTATVELQAIIENPQEEPQVILQEDALPKAKKEKFTVLDRLKKGVDRTLGSALLSDKHIIAYQRIKNSQHKNLQLRCFTTNDLKHPTHAIQLQKEFTYLRHTLTAVNENVVAMMGYKGPNEDNIYEVNVFLWDKTTQHLENVLIGTLYSASPESPAYHTQILTLDNAVYARLIDMVIIFNIDDTTRVHAKRLSTSDSIIYPAPKNTYFEVLTDRLYHASVPPKYISDREHVNSGSCIYESEDFKHKLIHKAIEGSKITTVFYDADQAHVLYGTDNGIVLVVKYNLNQVDAISYIPCPIDTTSKTPVKNVLVSQDGKYTLIHYKGNSLYVRDNLKKKSIIIKPYSENLMVRSFENSGHNREYYISSFDNSGSEFRFTEDGNGILYCNSEITIEIADIAARFEASAAASVVPL